MLVDEVLGSCAEHYGDPSLARNPKFAAMIFMAWQAGRWSVEDEISSSIQTIPDDVTKAYMWADDEPHNTKTCGCEY